MIQIKIYLTNTPHDTDTNTPHKYTVYYKYTSDTNTRYFRLPLGDSTAIMFSEPAFTMTLSLIILRCPRY